MKKSILLGTFVVASGFHTPKLSIRCRHQSSALNALSTTDGAKASLINIAEGLKTKQGILLYDSKAKKGLTKAVSELEAVASRPSKRDFETYFKGDWELICSTTTNSPGIDTSKLPFFNLNPVKNVRDSLKKSITVIQKITSTSDSTTVDRVDNVIEFEPPKSFEEVFGSFPDALSSLPINPLELSKAKVTLIHKAEVTCLDPKLITKILFQSTVLSVAGTSQYLNPAGEDVLGLNLPLAELRAGTFETTYLDEEIRVSRGKQGFGDQLRVFRKIKDASVESSLDEAEAEADLKAEAEADLKAELEAAMAEVKYVDSGVDDAPSDVEDADVAEEVSGVDDAPADVEDAEVSGDESEDDVGSPEDQIPSD